jgi:hypothetical protein
LRPIDNIGGSVSNIGGEDAETPDGRAWGSGRTNHTAMRSAWCASYDGSDNREESGRSTELGGIDDRTHTCDEDKRLFVNFVRIDFQLRHSFYYRTIIKIIHSFPLYGAN